MIPILGKPINFKDYTKANVVVHRVGWFGVSGHINMNYNSSDIAVCDDECQRMLAYGASGFNVDYYGPDSASELSSQRMLDACERAGMTFSLCADHGALGGLIGAAATAEYVRILRFADEVFFPSPAYVQNGGRKLVTFFGEPTGVNWTAVRAASKNKLALVFQGAGGFSQAESDGAFSWIYPLADRSPNIPSMRAFAAAAAANPAKIAMYSAYKGFDDSMAAWGTNRSMSYRLGQTMLDTLKLIPADAADVIIPTLDDFEEGTAIKYSQG